MSRRDPGHVLRAWAGRSHWQDYRREEVDSPASTEWFTLEGMSGPNRVRISFGHVPGRTDVMRVRFVKSAQRLGFSLDEIAELLRLEDGTHCEEASSLAEHKLKDVREKQADLALMEAALSGLVLACHATKGKVSCPLIESLQGGKALLSAGAA